MHKKFSRNEGDYSKVFPTAPVFKGNEPHVFVLHYNQGGVSSPSYAHQRCKKADSSVRRALTLLTHLILIHKVNIFFSHFTDGEARPQAMKELTKVTQLVVDKQAAQHKSLPEKD